MGDQEKVPQVAIWQFLIRFLNRNQARKGQLSRPGPSPSIKGKTGGKILEEALLGVLGGIKVKLLVMPASSGAYS